MPEDTERNQDLPKVEELEQVSARMLELEGLVAQREEELSSANARIVGLEQAKADLNNTLSQAVTSYKATVIRLNPEVPEELVTGDTVEAIDKSLGNAKTLIGRVREKLEAEVATTRVPAGAPQRTPPDLSALSPREKIQYAIGGRK